MEDQPNKPHRVELVDKDGNVYKSYKQNINPEIPKNTRTEINGVKIKEQTEFNELLLDLDEFKKALKDAKKEDKLNRAPDIANFIADGGRVTKTVLEDGSVIYSYDIKMEVDGVMQDVYIDYLPYRTKDGNIVYSPDFSKYQYPGCEIDLTKYGYELTGDKAKDIRNYKKILKELGINFPKKGDNYAAHHAMPPGVMQFIPEDIHKKFSHDGGDKFKGDYVKD